MQLPDMIRNKIKKLRALINITKRLKRNRKKIAFTNGCFDILHYGHVNYLQQAKKNADFLIVAVNSDKSVKKIKGKTRPINTQRERASIIAALECVDYVTIFDETTPLKIIQALKPDILVKGSDWKNKDIIGAEFVKKHGGRIIRAKLLKGHSTTELIKRIVKKNVKI
jgi:D-beta-D-heptose 7-phosphate kinase/D-beta-D-heptose 1-phosphate adenosyltransferase